MTALPGSIRSVWLYETLPTEQFLVQKSKALQN